MEDDDNDGINHNSKTHRLLQSFLGLPNIGKAFRLRSGVKIPRSNIAIFNDDLPLIGQAPKGNFIFQTLISWGKLLVLGRVTFLPRWGIFFLNLPVDTNIVKLDHFTNFFG